MTISLRPFLLLFPDGEYSRIRYSKLPPPFFAADIGIVEILSLFLRLELHRPTNENIVVSEDMAIAVALFRTPGMLAHRTHPVSRLWLLSWPNLCPHPAPTPVCSTIYKVQTQ